MFSFLRKKSKDESTNGSPKVTVEQFITLILNDERLMLPIYIPEFRLISDSEKLGIGPLVYIWNVNHDTNSFSLSVNGNCVAHLLETFVSRDAPEFVEFRDKAMSAVSEASLPAVQRLVYESGLMPDVLFSHDHH